LTLLTIVAQATAALGQPTLSTVVGSSDPAAILMRRLSTEGGKAVAKRHHWTALTVEKTFTTTAAAAQVASVATDFERLVPDTMFNRTSRRRVYGPIDNAEWQNIQASLTTSVDSAFRIRGSGTASILITPTPTAGDTIAYEYITKNWCQSNAAVGQTAWAADTDTSLLDEELHALDLIWRWRQAKGLEFQDERAAFENYLANTVMNDGARPRLQIGETMSGDRIPYPPQTPDTLVFT
jgi:hypothetical protein